MLRFGRRVMGVVAGCVALGGMGSAMPAAAGEMATPLAMASAVQAETPGAGSLAALPSPATVAMDMMRAGRAADALALLDPAAARLSIEGKAGKSRLYCAHNDRVARGARVLDGDLCDALFIRAFALTEVGRKADAIDALVELTRLSPDYPRYFVELAYAYRANRQPDLALATYTRAVTIADAPANREENRHYRAAALRGIGFVLVDRGDLAAGEKAYRASLVDDPASAIAANELKFIARKRADIEQKGG